MLSKEENDLLTQVDPGTAMGELFRRYWIPALLSEEISDPDCPPVRVRLLGEDLVAFRDTNGRIGLLDEHCSHRGTSLFYGRNEECGLTCIYHGWKYDVEGNVLDTPAEPAGSQLKNKVHHTAYPCVEGGGLVFAYMGPRDEKPVFPTYAWLGVPQNQIYIAKSLLECNYLQALDGDCDSAHLNFLHKIFKPDGKHSFLKYEDQAPKFEIDEMDFGFRVAAIRRIAADRNYVRLSHFVMPCIGCVPVGREIDGRLDGFKAVYQVPANNHQTWRYDFFFKWSKPMTRGFVKRDFVGADYRKLRNISNDYLQDRKIQKTVNFTGIEEFLNQDACATESMGPIADRTREHLGASDSYVIQVRRFLLKAVRDLQAGKPPPGLVYESGKTDFSRIRCDVAYLPPDVSWKTLLG